MIFKPSFLLIIQFLGVIELGNGQGPTVAPTAPPGAVWKDCPKYTTPYQKWKTFSKGNGVDSDYCYYFGSSYNDYDWHEAKDKCRSMNATLVSIHDDVTNYMLSHRKFANNEYSGNYYTVFWTGLNSLDKRALYKWADNSPVNYNNKFTDTTSSGSRIPIDIMDQGRCVSFRSISNTTTILKDTGLWYKEDCLTSHRLVCQKSISSIQPTEAPLGNGNCPQDWYQYLNKCIKYSNVSMTFNQSRDFCVKKNGGEILSIHSEEEQNFITAYTAGKAQPFIGFRTKSSYSYSGWVWDDNKPTDFTNWGVASSTSYYYASKCTTIITNSTQPGKWTRTMCNETHAVICEKPLDTKITVPGRTVKDEKCKISGFENFIQYRNSCYSVLDSDPNKYMNFTDAEESCKSMNGSSLVSIIDPFEEAFLRYYIKGYGKSDFYWIGLQSKVSSDTNVSQAFEWTNDWPIYYTNWDNYEPQFPGLPHEECVLFSRNNGTWRTMMCVEEYGYICKVTTDTLPKMNTDRSGVCPQHKNVTDKSLQWVDVDKRSQYCYWFSIDKKARYSGLQSWVDASFQCRHRNGTLISIHSNHDSMLLNQKFIQKGMYYNTWIGLTSNPEGDYTWEDGSGVQFTNWDPNAKMVSKSDLNNDDSRRQCVEVQNKNGMWRQTPCSGNDRNYYACEIKKIYHAKPTQSPDNIKEQQKSSKSKGLSGGAKAGIAFGVIGGVVALLAVGFFVFKSYRPNHPVVTSFENRLYASRRGKPQSNSSEPGVSFNNRQ